MKIINIMVQTEKRTGIEWKKVGGAMIGLLVLVQLLTACSPSMTTPVPDPPTQLTLDCRGLKPATLDVTVNDFRLAKPAVINGVFFIEPTQGNPLLTDPLSLDGGVIVPEIALSSPLLFRNPGSYTVGISDTLPNGMVINVENGVYGGKGAFITTTLEALNDTQTVLHVVGKCN